MSDKDKNKEVEKGAIKRDSKNQYGEMFQGESAKKRSSSSNDDAVIDHAHKISREKAKAHKENKNTK